ELKDIVATPSPYFSAGEAEDLFRWEVLLYGPAQSPYAGGVFKVAVEISTDYPFKPPKVKFTTKVYHPNIDDEGAVCMGLLKHDGWKPANKISDILHSLHLLLEQPNPDDAINTPVAEVYNSNRAKFDKTAAEWVKKYCEQVIQRILVHADDHDLAILVESLMNEIPSKLLDKTIAYEGRENCSGGKAVLSLEHLHRLIVWVQIKIVVANEKARKNVFGWHEFEEAIESTSETTEVVRFLLENKLSTADGYIMTLAIEQGRLEIVELLHEHDHKFNPEVLLIVDSERLNPYLHTIFCQSISERRLDVVRCSPALADKVARSCDIEVLKYFHQKCKFAAKAGSIDTAADQGNLKITVNIRKTVMYREGYDPCRWQRAAVRMLSSGLSGRETLIKYLIENFKEPWKPNVLHCTSYEEPNFDFTAAKVAMQATNEDVDEKGLKATIRSENLDFIKFVLDHCKMPPAEMISAYCGELNVKNEAIFS
ncbi:Ubiquitin-conjugating enzyme E2 4, partial [Phlyctochytrium planicorne]